jgi:hypothetical protein
LKDFKAAGSNAIAILNTKTTDGSTINRTNRSEGPVAWYSFGE